MNDSRLVGYSSSDRTLDARDLASLRPARANTPRKKAKPVRREVTSGIVCFCGERFSEDRALRAEVGEVLEWREKILARARGGAAKQRERMRSDPALRAKRNERERRRYAERMADPELRGKRNERDRQRRAAVSSEGRANRNEIERQYRREMFAEPERRARRNEYHREYQRAYRARKKAEGRGPSA